MSVSVDSAVVFPVFVLAKDCGEVMRFDSPEELEWLEPVDVENNEYDARDAGGKVLSFVATKASRLRSGDLAVRATAESIEAAKLEKLAEVAKRLAKS
jgi:hypothetical protein